MLLPIIIGALAVGSLWRHRRKRGQMTAERLSIFNAAVNGALKCPQKMDSLASAFEREGLSEQAKMLRQRSALMRLPDETKRARRTAFRKALKSTNKPGVIAMAQALDKEGCTGAAMRLREYASGLPDQNIAPEAPPVSLVQPAGTHAEQTGENDAVGEPAPPEAAP